MKKTNSTSKSIGNILALFQSVIDDVFTFIFKKLSKTTKENKENDGKIKRFFFKIGWFIGSIGENYYKKYNEIKKEKADQIRKK